MPGVAVTWLGHSTVLIEIDGVRLVTDPVLRGRVAHLFRRGPVPALPFALDAVLVSHAHHDHLDVPSLRRLEGGPFALVAPGSGSIVGRALRGSVRELRSGASARVGDVLVRAVPAVHDGRRLGRRGTGEPVGFLVEGNSRVYFAGDTDWFAGMAELGPLDVALVPVSGWGPGLGPGHLDPARAADAVALLRPGVAVPIHWGTYRLPSVQRSDPEVVRRPAEAFAAAVRLAAPQVRVAILAIGETLTLPSAERGRGE